MANGFVPSARFGPPPTKYVTVDPPRWLPPRTARRIKDLRTSSHSLEPEAPFRESLLHVQRGGKRNVLEGFADTCEGRPSPVITGSTCADTAKSAAENRLPNSTKKPEIRSPHRNGNKRPEWWPAIWQRPRSSLCDDHQNNTVNPETNKPRDRFAAGCDDPRGDA